MRKYLIISHNRLAEGMKNTIEFFTGKRDDLFYIDCFLDNEPVSNKLQNFLKNINDDDEAVIFTDLMGGSVNQEAIKIMKNNKIHVISGFNAALILGVVLSSPDDDLSVKIPETIEEARKNMCYMNTYKIDFEDED